MYEKTLKKPLEFRSKENTSEPTIDVLQKVSYAIIIRKLLDHHVRYSVSTGSGVVMHPDLFIESGAI